MFTFSLIFWSVEKWHRKYSYRINDLVDILTASDFYELLDRQMFIPYLIQRENVRNACYLCLICDHLCLVRPLLLIALQITLARSRNQFNWYNFFFKSIYYSCFRKILVTFSQRHNIKVTRQKHVYVIRSLLYHDISIMTASTM